MPDRLAYLFLDLPFVTLALAILIIRKDFWPVARRLFVTGAVIGLVSEFFYFRDYWRPQTFFGVGRLFSIEDILFGGAIMTLGVLLLPAIEGIEVRRGKLNVGRLLTYFSVGLAALLIAIFGLRLNSIFASSLIFMLLGLTMTIRLPGLIRSGFKTAVILSTFAGLSYLVVFGLLFPNFLSEVFFLHGSLLGLEILGSIPVTELLWYFSWGFFASIASQYLGAIELKTSQRQKSPVNPFTNL